MLVLVDSTIGAWRKFFQPTESQNEVVFPSVDGSLCCFYTVHVCMCVWVGGGGGGGGVSLYSIYC